MEKYYIKVAKGPFLKTVNRLDPKEGKAPFEYVENENEATAYEKNLASAMIQLFRKVSGKNLIMIKINEKQKLN